MPPQPPALLDDDDWLAPPLEAALGEVFCRFDADAYVCFDAALAYDYPNVAVVIADFLVRRGFVSPDDDGYLELLAELRNADCR